MNRPADIRTPPKNWLRVLAESYPLLREHGLGDLTLFGSQAMSIYLKNPLRSKDLDLVSSQIGPAQHDLLREHLSHIPRLELRSSSIQSRPLAKGDLKTYTIELRIDRRPFFLEIFDKILDGRSPTVLSDHLEEKKKWGIQLWVPSPSAIVALRLCFRQPEGISRLNAIRLNRFIQEEDKRISLREVRRLITQWDVWPLVRTNVEALYKRNRIRIANIEEIVPTRDD